MHEGFLDAAFLKLSIESSLWSGECEDKSIWFFGLQSKTWKCDGPIYRLTLVQPEISI